MVKKDIQINLFLCEEEIGFEELPIRRKIYFLAKLSNNTIKEWYYTLSGNNSLPTIWEDFKEMLIDFCTLKAIEDIKQFHDERCPSYFSRLYEIGIAKGLKEETILNKLRKEKSPQEIQVIVFSFNVTLKDMIKRITQWKNLKSKGKGVIKIATGNEIQTMEN